MLARFLPALRRLLPVAIPLALCLTGCGETEVPAIQRSADQIGNPDAGPQVKPRRNHCFIYALYLVEGDQFTFLSGGQETIDTSSDSSSASPEGWRPDIEARAKCKVDVNGYNARAFLFWNNVVVDQFAVDKTFMLSDQVEVLAYEDPDGTRVELHVLARPNCPGFASGVATREQVEASER